MCLEGAPPYSADRTLLTTGVVGQAMVSRREGHRRVLCPMMSGIRYESYPDDKPPERPKGERPSGATLDRQAPDDNWSAGGGRWRRLGVPYLG